MVKKKGALLLRAGQLKREVQDAVRKLAEDRARAMVKVAGGGAGAEDSALLVTDHALVRWLERKHGMDIVRMKMDMYADMVVAREKGMAKATSNGGVQVGADGVVYVVDPLRGVIVTCYPEFFV